MMALEIRYSPRMVPPMRILKSEFTRLAGLRGGMLARRKADMPVATPEP